MAKSGYRLGDLQLKIMQALWDGGPATVAGVQQRLDCKNPLAYTTVATMLRKMEARGLVTHQASGRRFIYSPAIAAGEVTRSMANDLVERLFEGSITDMVSHLLTTREVSSDELDQLQRLIAERKEEGSP